MLLRNTPWIERECRSSKEVDAAVNLVYRGDRLLGCPEAIDILLFLESQPDGGQADSVASPLRTLPPDQVVLPDEVARAARALTAEVSGVSAALVGAARTRLCRGLSRLVVRATALHQEATADGELGTQVAVLLRGHGELDRLRAELVEHREAAAALHLCALEAQEGAATQVRGARRRQASTHRMDERAAPASLGRGFSPSSPCADLTLSSPPAEVRPAIESATAMLLRTTVFPLASLSRSLAPLAPAQGETSAGGGDIGSKLATPSLRFGEVRLLSRLSWHALRRLLLDRVDPGTFWREDDTTKDRVTACAQCLAYHIEKHGAAGQTAESYVAEGVEALSRYFLARWAHVLASAKNACASSVPRGSTESTTCRRTAC